MVAIFLIVITISLQHSRCAQCLFDIIKHRKEEQNRTLTVVVIFTGGRSEHAQKVLLNSACHFDSRPHSIELFSSCPHL